MLVLGVMLLVAFSLIERYLALRPFIPWTLLVSKMLLGSLLINIVFSIAQDCWMSYFSSYLQVVYDMSVSQAGYINSGIFNVVSGVWQICVGLMISKMSRFKWPMVCALLIYILALGLMIYFRQPNIGVGFIVMCQVFVAFGGSTIILIVEVAVTADAEHQHLASVLGLLGMSGYIGSAIGNSISGAIWTNTLPEALNKFLPPEIRHMAGEIFGDLRKQLNYPVGSEVRFAIIQSYAVAQSRMLIGATAILGLALAVTLTFPKGRVLDREQVKGNVFEV